ncbi:MAG: hypothetical protein RLZZ338_2099, partial [Cyanobacteriota bacterium]
LVATDMGEPAPTEIMQKRDRVNSLIVEKPGFWECFGRY